MPNFHLGIYEILSLCVCEGWRIEKTFLLKQKSEIKRKHRKKSV